MQFLPLFVGYFKLIVQEFKHHSLQSAWCLADGLFEDRLEWLMVCMHCNVLLAVQIMVPFVIIIIIITIYQQHFYRVALHLLNVTNIYQEIIHITY